MKTYKNYNKRSFKKKFDRKILKSTLNRGICPKGKKMYRFVFPIFHWTT